MNLVAAYYVARRGANDSYSDLGLLFEKERLAGAILRDEVLEMMGRIIDERKRSVGMKAQAQQFAEGKQQKKKEPEPEGDSFEGMAREDVIERVKQRYQPGHSGS